MKAGWLGIVLSLAAACAPAETSSPPTIIVVSLDTVRADHLSVYGYARDTSPHLREFAREAVRFENAISQSSGTLPSHLSLITSRNPPELRITRDDGKNYDQATTVLTLPESIRTLTEVLKEDGYETAAFTGGTFLGGRYGFGQGFETLRTSDGKVRRDSRDFAQSLDRLRDHLAARREPAEPLFLFVHTYDAHAPYDAPEPHAGTFSSVPFDELERSLHYRPMPFALSRRLDSLPSGTIDTLRNLYDEGLAAVDASFGELVDVLREQGLYEDAIVVVLSDHGEEFLEHGGLGHGGSVYSEMVRVPLLIRLPGGAHGGRAIRAPVPLLDLAPTLLELAGLAVPEEFSGRSLVTRIEGSQDPAWPDDIRIYFESPNIQTGRFGLQWGRYRLVRRRGQEGVELYDLASDPDERRDLSESEPEIRTALETELSAWVVEMESEGSRLGWHAVKPRELRRQRLSAEEKRGLRQLGYLED